MEYISKTQMEVRDALKEKLLETRMKPTKELLEELALLADQTRELSAGQCSGVLDYGVSQGILKVLDKTDYGKASFEESQILKPVYGCIPVTKRIRYFDTGTLKMKSTEMDRHNIIVEYISCKIV